MKYFLKRDEDLKIVGSLAYTGFEGIPEGWEECTEEEYNNYINAIDSENNEQTN